MLAAAGSLAVGCGDDEGPPEFKGSDKEQVAATVSTIVRAMGAGDGEEACVLITDRGQRELVRIVNLASGGDDVSTCEEAVDVLPASRFDPGEVDPAPERVHISEADQSYAEVDCRDRSSAFLLRRVDDEWMVNRPYCVH